MLFIKQKQTTNILNQLLNDFYVLKRHFIYRFYIYAFITN